MNIITDKSQFKEGSKHIFKYISAIFRLTSAHMGKEFEHYKIGMGQIPYLLMLHFHKNINQKILSKLLAIDKATTTKSLKKLDKLGYIEKKRDPNDGRAYIIELTEKGKDIIPEILKELDRWHDVIFEDISDKDTDVVINTLRKMLENLFKEKGLFEDNSHCFKE